MTLRVSATPSASSLICSLKSKHGRLMFHQSGGCCDGSAPMCYPFGEFKIGSLDVMLGIVDGCPVYISGSQFEKWQHTQLILDVVDGRGSGFSLEAPDGVRFLTRSRVFTQAERDDLAALGPPPRGPEAIEVV
ncbi:MAG: DUF779 domain-containing protein [Pseudomonadota bacterium]